MRRKKMNQNQNSNKEVQTIIQLSNGVRFDAIVTGVGEITQTKYGYNFPIWVTTDIDVGYLYIKPIKSEKECRSLRSKYVDELNSRPSVFSMSANPGIEARIAEHKGLKEEPKAVVPIDVKAQITKAYQQGYRAGMRKGVRSIVDPIRDIIKV